MAVSARDWHEEKDPALIYGVNYLCIDESMPFAEAVKDAIRKKRGYMTAGPVLSLEVKTAAETCGIGDTIRAGDAEFRIVLDRDQRREVWLPYELEPECIHLINNDEIRSFDFPGYGVPLKVNQPVEKGFVFMELHGKAHNKPCRLLMTNPLIIE